MPFLWLSSSLLAPVGIPCALHSPPCPTTKCPLLKRLCEENSHPVIQHKSNIWKMPTQEVRKTHLPSLKRLRERQEPAETFFGDAIIGRHHFCNTFYIAGGEAGRCHFLRPLSALLAQLGVLHALAILHSNSEPFLKKLPYRPIWPKSQCKSNSLKSA